MAVVSVLLPCSEICFVAVWKSSCLGKLMEHHLMIGICVILPSYDTGNLSTVVHVSVGGMPHPSLFVTSSWQACGGKDWPQTGHSEFCLFSKEGTQTFCPCLHWCRRVHSTGGIFSLSSLFRTLFL